MLNATEKLFEGGNSDHVSSKKRVGGGLKVWSSQNAPQLCQERFECMVEEVLKSMIEAVPPHLDKPGKQRGKTGQVEKQYIRSNG
jgi:hypothetical protein